MNPQPIRRGNRLYTTEQGMEFLGLDPNNKKDFRWFRRICSKSYLGKHAIRRIHGRIPESEFVRISTLKI